jgi:hypothetical protein
MRVSSAWSQDVVLKAMCDEISQRRKAGVSVDFILATGDLAFSGRVDEYKLVASFFDALSAAAGVPKERIFCIPGNHDIERERQKMCFHGARKFIESQNQIDLLLSPGDDIETLLKRQENYRKFQDEYFQEQERTRTGDGLGYVSRIIIDDVHFAIVGLDSAWLAEGGSGDHGKLLVGERQVINAIDLASTFDCHVVLGMAHHPFHLLQEFDRRPVVGRIERVCQFLHCGHLHEPEARPAGFSSSGCLTLAAGASFETRQSHNSFSFITLDLLQGQRTVRTVQYSPSTGAFSLTSSTDYAIEIAPSAKCSVRELAEAMKAFSPSLSPRAYYLSGLLLDQKSELPIPAAKGYTFGALAVLLALPDDDLRRKTIEFMAFKNVLRVFYGRVSVSDMLARYGGALESYGYALEQGCKTDPELKSRLDDQEKDAVAIAGTEPKTSFSHTSALLAELAKAGEWAELRAQASRHLDSPDLAFARQAKRLLALGFANSEVAADKMTSAELYRSLIQEGSAEPTDAGNLATLLLDSGSIDEAKSAVLDGIAKFPAKCAQYFFSIGLKIVDAIGEREFRKQLEAALEARGKRD